MKADHPRSVLVPLLRSRSFRHPVFSRGDQRRPGVYLAFGAVMAALLIVLASSPPSFARAAGSAPRSYFHFDGVRDYLQVNDSDGLSVATKGGLTVSAWIRPSTLVFPNTEGSGYVHWLGKGEGTQQEWTFRMYSQDNTEGRANRISFYLFNLAGPALPNGGYGPNIGIGSYFQDAVTPGAWIHVVGTADDQRTYIYKDGRLRDQDKYRAPDDPTVRPITPQNGTAPLRIGTRDFQSYFPGDIAEVKVWSRALTQAEVSALYLQNIVPQNGLVAEFPKTN